MKLLTSLSLALVLAFGAASASAGDKHKQHKKHHNDRHVSVHHGGHKHGKHYRRHHYERQHYGHRYRHHYNRHYNHRYNHHYRHRHDYHGYRGGYWRYRRHGDYYPYIGVAIAGSLIGHRLYHLHGDTVCYDDHERDRRGERRGGYSEVVGCHRIERLPDGSERRVDVPLSECN